MTIFFKNPIWPPKPKVVCESLENCKYGQIWSLKEKYWAILYI